MRFNVTDPVDFTGNEDRCTCDGACKRGEVNATDDESDEDAPASALDVLADGGAEADDGDAGDAATVDPEKLVEDMEIDDEWVAALTEDVQTGVLAAGLELTELDEADRRDIIDTALRIHIRSRLTPANKTISPKEAGAEAGIAFEEHGDASLAYDGDDAARADGGESDEPAANTAGEGVTDFGVQVAGAVSAARSASAASTTRSKRGTANYLGRGMPPRDDDDDEDGSVLSAYNKSLDTGVDRSKPSTSDILRNEATEKVAEKKREDAHELAANATRDAGLDDEWTSVVRMAANRYPREAPYSALKKAVGELPRSGRPPGWEDVISGGRTGASVGGVGATYGTVPEEQRTKTFLGGPPLSEKDGDGR